MKVAYVEIKGTDKRTGKSYQTSITYNEYLPEDNNHYGNGIYCGVKYGEGNGYVIDCRYKTEYDFHSLVINEVKSSYGASLEEFTVRFCE